MSKLKEILKYIENGISMNGNPKDGYNVFTIPTQHFRDTIRMLIKCTGVGRPHDGSSLCS